MLAKIISAGALTLLLAGGALASGSDFAKVPCTRRNVATPEPRTATSSPSGDYKKNRIGKGWPRRGVQGHYAGPWRGCRGWDSSGPQSKFYRPRMTRK